MRWITISYVVTHTISLNCFKINTELRLQMCLSIKRIVEMENSIIFSKKGSCCLLKPTLLIGNNTKDKKINYCITNIDTSLVNMFGRGVVPVHQCPLITEVNEYFTLYSITSTSCMISYALKS